jgi:photosystem II stability/assembly factor-like uncharacterized protein
VAIGVKQTLLNIAFADDKLGWIVGWNGVILRTGDGGKSWVEQVSGTRVNLYGLAVRKDGFFSRTTQAWVVGAEGMVLRYRTR